MVGECGVITYTVLHMKHGCYIKDSSFKIGVQPVGPQHYEYVLCSGKLWIRSVYEETVIAVVVNVCLISIRPEFVRYVF